MKEEPEYFTPKSRHDWRDWLAKNHAIKKSVWCIMYKSSANVPTINWSDAVDEALCFGWIDSVRYSVDELCFKQYYSPRKPKSIWSKINKDKVERLIKEGKMTAAGQKCIDIAQQNGAWTFLDSIDALIVPEELDNNLSQIADAKLFFENLSASKKKLLLYWIKSAKTDETRQKRIRIITESMAESKMPANL